MIISMTPLRVSFFGGGTDFPEHFLEHGGVTLGTSIDKYTYITVSPLTEFFDHRVRVSYSKTELCSDVSQIEHPAVRECTRFVEIEGGIEITVVADLPARTGLGSSSSFTVGLLHALHGFKGEMVTREQLASEAVYVERELIRERVGLQDQYTCGLGGLIYVEYGSDGRVSPSPVVLPAPRLETLQDHLMLFYTGLQRRAHQVLEDQVSRTAAGALTSELGRLSDLAAEALDVLASSEDLSRFGELLHDGWMIKRSLSESISSEFIDSAYERAQKAGAIGGKLLGAGGGGFLLLFVAPERMQDVRTALPDLREVNFRFEGQGSRLIFYRP